MSTRKLREENEEFKKRIKRLEIALLNAEAIKGTYLKYGEMFDEVKEVMLRMNGRISNLESELGNQKNLIVRGLQQKYGTGPTT